MKKWIMGSLAILLGVMSISIPFAGIHTAEAKTTENTAAEALKGADAKNTDGGWKDGTYEGEGQGFGGKVVVEVTIESGEITCIEVKEAQKEDSAYLEMAKDIIEDIVDAQSADVDTISGATFSSTGIREAVTQALEKAE